MIYGMKALLIITTVRLRGWLLGMFVPMFVSTVVILLKRSKMDMGNWVRPHTSSLTYTSISLHTQPMFIAACFMFALATAHVGACPPHSLLPFRLAHARREGIDCRRLLIGYVFAADLPGGPATYFSDPSLGTHIAADTIYVTQTLLGDAFNVRFHTLCVSWSWLIVRDRSTGPGWCGTNATP